MKLPPAPSWPRVACATAAAVAACFPLGLLAELIWAYCFAAFGALMLLALVTLQFDPRSRRVPGVPVKKERASVS